MTDAAYAVPTQNIKEDGFKGFLPSTWSENSLEVFPDEILGKYDVEIEWNGTRTLTIEKDNLRWNGARLTPTAVWCQRSHGISDFATRFTAFCPDTVKAFSAAGFLLRHAAARADTTCGQAQASPFRQAFRR